MTADPITWTNDTRLLSDLVPWEHNPKRMTKKQADGLRLSIERFGFAVPFLVSPDGDIYDGHQRQTLMNAIREYGPNATVDVRVSSRPLTDDERRELVVRLKQNQAGWDFDMLPNLYEREELLEWGFEPEELGMYPDDEKPDDPGAQIDRAEELREKWQVETGQLWALGEHRLICGDCTDAAVVGRVMGGETAHLLMTSPPYWVGKDYEQEQSWEEVQAFIVRSAIAFAPAVTHRMVINTGAPPAARLTGERAHIRLLIDDWQRELHERGFLMRYIRIWSKRGGLAHTAPRSDCIDQHWEFIATFYRPETYEGQRRLGEKWATDGIWDDVEGEMSSHGHVAAFPLEIPERNIRLYTDNASLVLEPFLGSGTTLIACERLGRRCRAVEISPGYCAVAIQRWVDMTGGEPVLLEPALTVMEQ